MTNSDHRREPAAEDPRHAAARGPRGHHLLRRHRQGAGHRPQRQVVPAAQAARRLGRGQGHPLRPRRRRRREPRNGDVVKVSGTYSVHEKFGQQFQVKRLRVMEPGEYDIGTLVPVSPVPLDELVAPAARARRVGAQPSLRALLERALDPVARARRHLRHRAGGGAQPPRLPSRPARALARSSPRWPARSPSASPPSTATSRWPARCCTTSARCARTRPTPWPRASPTPAGCTARSSSATTSCAASSPRSPASRPRWPPSCATSSSRTTASARRAARSCRPPAKRSSSTTATT